MRKLFLAISALLLWVAQAQAQVTVVYPGAHRFGELVLSAYTVAELPQAFNVNTIFIVSDGIGTDDCVTGGGAEIVLCVWNGSSYAPLSGAAPEAGPGVPGGSTSQVQYNAGSGNFGGDAGMTYNSTTNTLTVDTVVGNLTGNVTGTVSGNSGTATALAANGANCSAGSAPLGVDASGAVESCFDVATQTELDTHTNTTSGPHGAVSTNTVSRIVTRDGSGNFAAGSITASLNGNAGTATALAANGTNCAAGEAAQGVDASGNAEGCFTPAGSGSGTPGGADTQVQFNNAGSFAGDAGMTFNSGTNVLTVTGGVVANLTGNASGNAGTATALASNGANCTAGSAPLGVDASGAAESCFDVATQAELNTHTSDTAAHSATSANTVSRIVARDGSGNFSAGTISAALSGNATTATALAANGSNCSAGSAPIGVDAAGNAESCFDVATQTELNTHAALTGTSAHGATSTNTASQLVARDGSGNFAAGTITATLSGNASTATALASNPTDCSANQYANAIAANGNLTCGQVGFSELSGTTNTINATHIDETDNYAFSGNTTFTKLKLIPVTVANLPASPTAGQLAVVSDAASSTVCEVGGGTSQVLCIYSGVSSHWEPVDTSGGNSSQTLQQVADTGRSITNAVDVTTSLQVGNEVIKWQWWCDSSNDCHNTTSLPSNTVLQLHEDKSLIVKDSTGATIASITEATGIPSGFERGTILTAGDSGSNFTCASTLYFSLAQYFVGTEANAEMRLPRAGTALNLYVDSTAIPAGQTVVWTLRKAGQDTSLTCTQTEGQTQCSDTSNTVTFAQGDKIALKAVCSGGSTAISLANISLIVR